jgi:hypothetical protein
MNPKRLLHFSLLVATLFSSFSGCATVLPYERADLMTAVMEQPVDVMESAFEVHIHRTREAMAGAELGEGASCGCY